MTEGLWPHIQEGSAAAVSAGIRVSERRSRLLGLDAPVATKSELSGSLGVYAERLEADRALFGTLTVEQLEELALESEALIAKARAMAQANTSRHDHSTSPRTLPNLEIIDVPPSAEPT
jgi:hypothetical protein